MRVQVKKRQSEVCPPWHHFGGRHTNDLNQAYEVQRIVLFEGSFLEGRV